MSKVQWKTAFEFIGNCNKTLSASMPPNRPCLSVWCGATCCPRPEGTMSFRTGEYCAFYTIVALKHLQTPCKICKTVVPGEVDTSRLDLTNWILDLFSFECLHKTRRCAHATRSIARQCVAWIPPK